jgi:RHS repeat-associated protein
MAYDGLNRLTSVSAPDMFGIASYAYDVQDNLKHVQVTAGSQPRNVDYCYDAANRLTNVTLAAATYCGGATVTGLGYDVQGNLANKDGVLYAFDQGNRLRSVSGALGAYLYDGHGRRVQDTVGGVAKRSQYTLSGQLVMSGDDRAGKVREYISLGGSLVLIRERDIATGDYTMLYQHNDALGSPVAVTTETRALVERREYEPYGYQTAPFALKDGPGYTGHVADAATGLVYMQQRYYDPLIARFLSRDEVTAYEKPLTNFNAYVYALNNPYRFTDPDGRDSVGEMIDSAAEGCGAISCAGWAMASAAWNVFGAEGISQIADKGWSNADGASKASAALEVAAVLPPVKLVGEAADAAKALVPSAKTVAKIERQLAKDGVKSVQKSQQKLERRLAEHADKLTQIKEAGGHTSSVEREMTGFKKELEAIKQVLENLE